MADGFLAPTGRFYPKTDNFHAQTARAILGPDGQTDEPIQELLRRGYILFVGFHKPGEPENLHADMDYVLGGPGHPATEGQKAWIAEHVEELSGKQQFDINNDEITFQRFYISNIRMFPWCRGCAEEKARELWGNAQKSSFTHARLLYRLSFQKSRGKFVKIAYLRGFLRIPRCCITVQKYFFFLLYSRRIIF